MHYINLILGFINTHAGWSYIIIFLVSFSESLAIVGLIMPGSTIMFGVGAIIAAGGLDIKLVIIIAITGAIGGDGISFWTGHYYKEKINKIWPFSRYPGLLKRGENFFHRHGGKSVLIGRFVGPVRPIIPVIAGTMGMPPLYFTIINIISAIGWAFAYIVPGIILGASIAVIGTISIRLAIIIVIIVFSMWILFNISLKAYNFAKNEMPKYIESLRQWSSTYKISGNILSPFKRFIFYLFRQQHGEETFLAMLILIFVLALWISLGINQDVLANDPIVQADKAVYHFFNSIRVRQIDHVFVAITELGDSIINICITIAVFLILIIKRCFRTSVLWLISFTGALFLVQTLKWIMHLPRPIVLYQGASAYSFPSGHTTMSIVIFGFLCILLIRNYHSVFKWLIFTGALFITFSIALSRLYLGAHWLSDVLGGFFIGTLWVALIGILYLKQPYEKIPKKLLATVTLSVFIFAGSWHINNNIKQDTVLYSLRKETKYTTFERWNTNDWSNLPVWRVDMGGEREQPLNFQFAGEKSRLRDYLLSKGWEKPSPIDFKSLLETLSSKTSLQKLPVFPYLNSGEVESLKLVHYNGDMRTVFRMWDSDTNITPDNITIYAGMVENQQLHNFSWLLNLPKDTRSYDDSLQFLKNDLTDHYNFKTVKRTFYDGYQDNNKIRWKGHILLIW